MSEPAIVAMESLDASWFLNWVIRGSIHDPSMGGDDHHPNHRFFADVEWYLTCRQIAHAGDVLNTYCQSILASVLEADSSIWDVVKSKLRGKSPVQAIEKLKVQAENDKAVRQAIRESLGVNSTPEAEIIAVLRNKIVHQGGIDPGMEVAQAIRDFPPGTFFIYPPDLPAGDPPFTQDADGRLMLDARAGYWASRHIGHHIHMLDQMLCHRYGLQRRRSRSKRSGFTYSPPSSGLPFPPGTPLPTATPPPAHDPTPPTLNEFPTYTEMADPKEAECVAAWHAARGPLDDFVRKYCIETDVSIRRLRSSVAGRIRSHTVAGHDLQLLYGVVVSGESDGKINEVGIRFRQDGFTPFLTVWSTKSQMRDFRPCVLSDEVKEYLRNCIDDAVSP